ncbi:unnamed protein product [Victoria cruziana]
MVPSGEVLSFGDDNFMMLEEVGVKEACHAAFVLVAGGLGERLGYNGIKAIPAALGVSATKSYHVNSLAVPRKAKEAIGGITRLTHSDGRTMVINVEYNQLDPLLRATGHPDGDVNDETGYSPFPGNINQLILELGPYMDELRKTNATIFRYKDSTKTSFKSSTRLECMMQDYPKTLPPTAKVGFTVMDAWLAYSPVKNNPDDAAKVPKGNPHHSATTGEMAIYRANSIILRKAGARVEDPKLEVYNGQEVEVWPRVKLNGHVKNEGWELRPVDCNDGSLAEEMRIRGFQIEKKGQLELNFVEPGNFSLND